MGSKPNTNIDTMGVAMLKLYLTKYARFNAQYIEEGGSEPIWDGYIGIKATDGDSAVGFRRVPIQLKSTTADTKEKFSVEREYLEGFRTEGYGLFIVVEVVTEKIMYKFFDKKLLDATLKEKFYERTFNFESVPDSSEEFYKLCKMHSLRNEQLHGRIEVSFEEARKYTSAELFCVDEIKTPFDLLNKNVFLKLNGDNGYDAITNIIQVFEIAQCEQTTFCHDKTGYSFNIQRSKFKDKTVVKIGKSVEFIFRNDEVNFKISDKGNICESVKEYEFALCEILKAESKDEAEHMQILKEIKAHIVFLKNIYSVVEKIGLNAEEIFFSKISDTEKKIMAQIIEGTALVKNTFGLLHLGGKAALICSKVVDGKICIKSVFKSSDKIKMMNTGCNPNWELYSTSPAMVGNGEILSKIDNFEKDACVNALLTAEVVPEEYRDSIINEMALELIKGYDLKNNSVYLDAAFEIYEQLQEDDNILLNKLQIKKRKGILEDVHLNQLIELKETNGSTTVKWACSILLNNGKDAQYWFDKIENKDNISIFPIYSLYLKLIE